MYGKATETAIAAVSRLSEVYDGGITRLSAAQIAESRGLQRPYVGKVLSALSLAGIVTSVRGPGGGFSLARAPSEIRLHDVASLFERVERVERCPFGGGICGVGEECALHSRLADVRIALDRLMRGTTFAVFTAQDRTGLTSSPTEQKKAGRKATGPPAKSARARSTRKTRPRRAAKKSSPAPGR